MNEEVTLKNFANAPASLTGWKLRDLAKTTWSLDAIGTLAAGEERIVRRNGQAMAMTNRGDTIDLVDSNGAVVQSVTYPSMPEGEEVLAHTH